MYLINICNALEKRIICFVQCSMRWNKKKMYKYKLKLLSSDIERHHIIRFLSKLFTENHWHINVYMHTKCKTMFSFYKCFSKSQALYLKMCISKPYMLLWIHIHICVFVYRKIIEFFWLIWRTQHIITLFIYCRHFSFVHYCYNTYT